MRVVGALVGGLFLLPSLALAQPGHLTLPRAPVEAANGMVVTAQHYASEIGADVLKRGGNAVDAAVAIGYALAVTYPSAGNIGGGGLATIHLANGPQGNSEDTFIDFPCF